MSRVIEEPLRLAVVGYGYWGPNLVRNALERPELELVAVCERDRVRASRFAARHPDVEVRSDFQAVLADASIEAVCVATPPKTHHTLVRQALHAGKHVLVEKPLATSSRDAQDLVDLAEARQLVLMPGHTYLYSPSVNKVRQLIARGEVGDVYFVTSARMNLGIYQSDGVVWDLAPHDLSILLYWIDEDITRVRASGRTVFQAGVPETAFITLEFEHGPAANIQLSWLAPRKVRQMIVVGSKRMVQYDDTETDASVRIYDRGLDVEPAEAPTFGEYRLMYRSGDMVAPRIDAAEPLGVELADFAGAVRSGTEPQSHARLGLEVVRVLEAATLSLAREGEPVVISRSGALVARTTGFAQAVEAAG